MSPAALARRPEGPFRFTAGLSADEAWWASRRLAELQAQRPLRGFRLAMRIGALVADIRRGLVNNAAWGRSMLGKRGGLARRDSPNGPSLKELARREHVKRVASAELRRLRAMGREAMVDPIHLKRDGLTEAERLYGVPPGGRRSPSRP